MKHSILAMMIATMMIGCAAHPAAPPQIPTQEIVIPPAPKVETANPDAFDKAGGMLADGSRYVWNEATQAYEWTEETIKKWYPEVIKTWYTEDNKEKVESAIEEARLKSQQAYESLQKAMQEAVSRDKCGCLQGDPLCACVP